MQAYQEMLKEKFVQLSALNWEDVTQFSTYTQALLTELAQNKEMLTSLLHAILEDQKLLALCERNPVLSRIVLYNDETADIRLRLHIFSVEVEDKPHDHRWSFSSVILNGSYTHVLYTVNSEINENLRMQNLKPVLEQEETPGSTYSLHHSAIHTTIVKPDTVSIILRGPVRKTRWLNVDRQKDQAQWHGGKDKEQKIMGREEYVQILDTLKRLNVCHAYPVTP